MGFDGAAGSSGVVDAFLAVAVPDDDEILVDKIGAWILD